MSQLLQDFQKRAEEAETKLRQLEDRIKLLEASNAESKVVDDEKRPDSNLVLGLRSTMGDDYQLNIKRLMDRGPIAQPNTEVITQIHGGYHKMTWLEVQQRATQLASALSKQGIKPGDRVATFMWNNGRHLQLYYAVPSMGSVLHTINIRLAPKELNYIITHAQDKIMFVDATLLPLFERIPPETFNNVEKIIICGPNEAPGNWKSDKLPKNKLQDFDEFFATGDKEYDWPNIDERSAMSLCYTSGTTGNPKGVLYSHRSTFIHTLTMMTSDIMNISGSDCVLPYVPMFHALAWATPFSAMCLGYKYLLYNCYRLPEHILQNMSDNQCTLVAGVPSVLQGIQAILTKDPKPYEKLKGVLKRGVCGGSAPPPSMIKWYFDEWNVEIIHGWGMTEMNPVGSIARRCVRRNDLNANNDQLFENQIVQGLCPPTVDAKIVDPDNYNKILSWDGKQMGELLVRGPSVTTSYYKIDASHKFHNGWLITGDIASFDKNARLTIRDRSKDLIKSSGEWISSVALENCIMGMKQIKLACVVGVYHPKHDERPIVIAQLQDKDNKPSLNDIKQFCLKTGSFAKWQLPDDIIFRDSIPLGATGKMNKRGIRQELEESKYVLPELRNPV